jgi:hypothetical protein
MPKSLFPVIHNASQETQLSLKVKKELSQNEITVNKNSIMLKVR